MATNKTTLVRCPRTILQELRLRYPKEDGWNDSSRIAATYKYSLINLEVNVTKADKKLSRFFR